MEPGLIPARDTIHLEDLPTDVLENIAQVIRSPIDEPPRSVQLGRAPRLTVPFFQGEREKSTLTGGGVTCRDRAAEVVTREVQQDGVREHRIERSSEVCSADVQHPGRMALTAQLIDEGETGVGPLDREPTTLQVRGFATGATAQLQDRTTGDPLDHGVKKGRNRGSNRHRRTRAVGLDALLVRRQGDIGGIGHHSTLTPCPRTAPGATRCAPAGPSGAQGHAGHLGTGRPPLWCASGDVGRMQVVDAPGTKYAKTIDGVHIAYQVLGSGPTDIVVIPSSYVSNLELAWEWPYTATLLRGLAARGRLVQFDRRGTGLSDGVDANALPSLEARMDDIRAVMDAAGSQRAVLHVMEDAIAQGLLFAATFPECVVALITTSAQVRGSWAPDYPFGWGDEEWDNYLRAIEAGWGTESFARELVEWLFPTRATDVEFIRSYARLMRHSMSPGAALAVERMGRELDVRHLLPAIQCPTLVIQPEHGEMVGADEGRYFAARIAGARFAEVPGADHDPAAVLPLVDEFMASLAAEEAEFERVLATVLFTDIVGSTQRAVELGDRAWKDVLEQHNDLIRALLRRYHGREIGTAGDSFTAAFDGPARAVRCALAIHQALRPLGLQVRAGMHTGEVETIGDDIGGIAVHIGARVAGLAGPDEILVSSTVKELVTGSGLMFTDAGEHQLKGAPDTWHLYRVVDPDPTR